MNWRIALIIGIIFAAIAGYSLYMMFTGEIVVIEEKKLNVLTGEYEPRYSEYNSNTIFMIPAILGLVGAIVGIIVGCADRELEE